MPNTDNGRATLARVIADLTSQDRRAEERHADIKTDLGILKVCTEQLAVRIRNVELEQVRNDEQHKAMKSSGVILSSIQASVAALVGVFIKG